MPAALDDYDFCLPPALIAQKPPQQRDGGRLLHVGAKTRLRRIADLPALLRAGDLLVLNNTRVLPARLCGRKSSGGRAEILLERLLGGGDCLAQIGASKAAAAGARVHTAGGDFIVRGRQNGFYRLSAVDARGRAADAKRRFLRFGQTPLPPYIKRAAEEEDRHRYQTVFARRHGSVAAPTAGLHFTPALLRAAAARGVKTAQITLHVGAGTFAPIRGRIAAHKMHEEIYTISKTAADAVNAAKSRGGRVVAAGTTVLRALETAADREGKIAAATQGATSLFIQPGFVFRAADVLLTNFHLPRSSLLLAVCAFGGRARVLAAYRRAVRERMRFYSYGDAMLLER